MMMMMMMMMGTMMMITLIIVTLRSLDGHLGRSYDNQGLRLRPVDRSIPATGRVDLGNVEEILMHTETWTNH